jgi:hypothetical protein
MNEIFNQFNNAIIPQSDDDEAIEMNKMIVESSPKSKSIAISTSKIIHRNR